MKHSLCKRSRQIFLAHCATEIKLINNENPTQGASNRFSGTYKVKSGTNLPLTYGKDSGEFIQYNESDKQWHVKSRDSGVMIKLSGDSSFSKCISGAVSSYKRKNAAGVFENIPKARLVPRLGSTVQTFHKGD